MSDSIPRGPFDQGLFLTHFNKGRDLYDARRFEDAERQLEEAYLMRPRDARVLNLLGLVYFRGNKLAKAEEVYRKLVAENPDAGTLYYNLGLICFKLNRLEDAEQAFRKALELSDGNPKIHFYLGSIYERLQRYKDAIYQYREAGANLMVQRLEGKLDPKADSGAPPADSTAPPGLLQPPPRAAEGGDEDPEAVPASLIGKPKVVEPVSPSLLAEEKRKTPSTDRFRTEDALHPVTDTRPPRGTQPLLESAEAEPVPPAATRPRAEVEDEPAAAPAKVSTATAPSLEARPELFRGLQKGLMEVEVSGKVFIKQGTIYSYTGNLTFWVKEKRPGGRAALVIVTGTGRLLLTDRDREITLMQVSEEPVYVEPAHLLACEEGLQPRYQAIGEGSVQDVVLLEGKGMLALSVASKPLPLTVKPGLPVCVPASSVIMWTGDLAAYVVDDPQVYAVVLPSAAGGGSLLRLEGSGRILVEQTGV